MPSITKSLLFLAAISQAALVLAAPVPQLAGEGSACDSVLSSTDNGVGYGVENAEDNTASTISGAKVGRRQLAGEGSACNSILSSTDDGVGYGIENAEDNTASLLSEKTSTTSATGSGAAAPPPPPPKFKRQGDKIANGLANIISAAGSNQLAQVEQTVGDNADGELTSGVANLGAQIGSSEESTLEGIGKTVPKVERQGDKIANGAASVISALGQDDLAAIEKSNGDTLDGQLTGDAADAGAQLGAYEESTLENAGKTIPK